MSEKKQIGFGIVGAGMISAFHAQCIKEIAGARLVAIADKIPEKARQAGEKYGVDHYDDYHKMFQRDDINVINICTPSGLHLEPALAAAQAGKHLIIEKPLEITLDRVDQIINTCKKAKVKLACIFQRRFDNAAQKLKQAVENNQLGRIILGDAYIKWFRTHKYYADAKWRGTLAIDGGAALMNQSIHTIDLLQWIMGPVQSIFGKVGTFTHDIEGEDIGLAILTFKNGAVGVIEGSTSAYPGFPSRLEIHGEKGTVIISDRNITTWEIEGEAEKPAELFAQEAGSGSSDPTKINVEGHKPQIEDMINAIYEGRDPTLGGSEARKAVQIITSIYESSKTGKVIRL